MQRDELVELLDVSLTADLACRDRDVLVEALRATVRLAAWCESQRLVCTQALETVTAAPEQVIAETTRSDAREVDRLLQRSRTAQSAPQFGAALADGRIAAGHVDHLGQSLRRLNETQRAVLLSDTARLATLAANSTPDQFARTLRAEERRLADDDGMDRLARQRQAVRLRSRVEPESGMHIWTLTLDPVTGLKLYNRVQAATEALFHTTTPPDCPTDPLDKQAFLRAHALLGMLNGHGVRMARPEIVVVIDTTVTADGAPVVDWGLPAEIPDRVLQELYGDADTHTVIIRGGVVLHAPGQLNLGRCTRLANRAQRRALRALYATCAIPGCAVRFDNCTIHHVHWWRHGGRTDFCNLLPLCSKHHHLVHEGGWNLHLAADRTLTITLPDATTMTTGPPRRAAA
jgi:hypothetical protein